MAPLYDYECPDGHVFEVFTSANDKHPKMCPRCLVSDRELKTFGYGRRIISKVSTRASDDSNPEIRGSADVVDPSESREAADFVRNPTRKNQDAYMKRHNLRFFEDGERPQKPKPVDTDKLVKETVEMARKRDRITI